MTDQDSRRQNIGLVRFDRVHCDTIGCGLRHVPRSGVPRPHRERHQGGSRLSTFSLDARGSGKDPELTPVQEIGFLLANPKTPRGTRNRK